MLKIIVIGCPGAGKSTFAKELGSIIGLPIYHLDLIWNRPDKTTITRDDFDKALEYIFKQDKWILDGNYQRTMERRLQECDTVFLLDYPLEVCMAGATGRVGKDRDDMPWKEEKLNEEFKQKILDFSQEKLPQIYKLLETYKQNKDIKIFKNRDDAQNYLNKLSDKVGGNNE